MSLTRGTEYEGKLYSKYLRKKYRRSLCQRIDARLKPLHDRDTNAERRDLWERGSYRLCLSTQWLDWSFSIGFSYVPYLHDPDTMIRDGHALYLEIGPWCLELLREPITTIPVVRGPMPHSIMDEADHKPAPFGRGSCGCPLSVWGIPIHRFSCDEFGRAR